MTQRETLLASIARRNAILAAALPLGSDTISFLQGQQILQNNPKLAREFQALQEEREELEALDGIETIQVTASNYGQILCCECGEAVEIGMFGRYCFDHLPTLLEEDELDMEDPFMRDPNPEKLDLPDFLGGDND